ncbi:MAG: hypothetical protein RL653_3404 [Pseudomonadota bacterium]
MPAAPVPASAVPDGGEAGIEHNQVMPPDAAVQADTLAELELTSVGQGADVGEVGLLEGLDTGRMDGFTAGAEESAPPEDFDSGRLGDEHVAWEATLEAEIVADDDEDEAVVEAEVESNRIPCPACGTPDQVLGTVCDGCGRRLPQPQRKQIVMKADESSRQDTVWVRCKACGVPARAGKPCNDCGVISPFPSDD